MQVTEESLATFFADCGTVMDCRICGDPNSAMRFAFIEFMEELGAQEVRGSAVCCPGLLSRAAGSEGARQLVLSVHSCCLWTTV